MEQNPPPRGKMEKSIAIVGDYVTDVIFAAESRLPLSSGKETGFPSSFPDTFITRGPGAVFYQQDIFKCMFETHFPPPSKGKHTAAAAKTISLLESIATQYDWSDTKVPSASVNHWTVAKRRADLNEQFPQTYRAVERNGSISERKEAIDTLFKKDTHFVAGGPEILLVADYGRDVRYNPQWSTSPYHDWLLAPSDKDGLPKRVIQLGNKLPAIALGKQRSGEIMWETIFSSPEALRSTVVVTSIDRLRNEGANLSKRLSWDMTLTTFQEELADFEPLKQLARVGHLVIRIGVVGAIHCYWDEQGRRQLRFIYDPRAKQGVFRDRALQGNAFGIRSVTPAAIAFHILMRKRALDSTELTWGDQGVSGAIRRGIKDAIAINQRLFTKGLGTSLEEVNGFISDQSSRLKSIKECLEKACKSHHEIERYTANAMKVRGGKSAKTEEFLHIIRPPALSPRSREFGQWSVLKDNFRAMIKPDELWDELHSPTSAEHAVATDFDAVLKDLRTLEELRRLRMGRAIVLLGPDAALNNLPAPLELSRKNFPSGVKYLEAMLNIERRLNANFCMRFGTEREPFDIRHLVVPEWWNEAYPLSGPISIFDSLRVMGRKDSENLGSIRNLLSSHLSERRSKPISLAVFGDPGSGKSFAIRAIAKAIGRDSIEAYTCNLSQLKDREDLNREFFNAFQILLRGKTPLVFFDEFDCTMPTEGMLGWLKYFLEPMQDGIFRHNHGIGQLGNAIFVFAGGTKGTFTEFCEDLDAKERKAMKLPDFISRIRGFIDVPGLNRTSIDPYRGMPFIRRALVLRALIEEDRRLLDENGIARVDRNIVDAFLRVKRYHHGARSMASVLGMCMRWGNGVEKVSLPTKAQLNIHTIGKHFLNIANATEAFDPTAVLEEEESESFDGDPIDDDV